MGVSGSGKSTVGAELARLLGATFVDGDDLHPASNKAKMAAGTPLTDEDRWPWLERVEATLAGGLVGGSVGAGASAGGGAALEADAAATALGAAGDGATGRGVVVACSALRRVYRDVLRGAGPGVRFVYLEVDRAEIEERLGRRHGHFFPPALVASQFATLEVPAVAEEPDVIALAPHGSARGLALAAQAALLGAD